jgi:tRNA acetyltransferase TAN1
LLTAVQYLEKMYGIKEKDTESEDGDVDDIEAAIQKEVAAIKADGKGDDEDRYFTPMKMNVDCLLFFKTKAPIEPLEFVRRICTDAKAREPGFKCRYVNRFTPVTVIGKASESGLLEVARRALAPIFKLNPSTETPAKEGENMDAETSEQAKDGTSETKDDSESKPAVTEPETREYKPSTVSDLPSIPAPR